MLFPVPTQQQRSDATRGALVDAATRLFGDQGYTATSLADITHAAGVSKGGFYHHFDDKQELFQAVFEQLEQHAADEVSAAFAGHAGDVWQQAIGGLDAFLQACTQTDYRRIVLCEGPIALGPQRWRELDEHYLFGALRAALERLINANIIEEQPIDLLTRSMCAFLTELALAIAEADDHHGTRQTATRLARRVFAGLTTSDPATHQLTTDS